MILRDGISADAACGGMRMLVVWCVVERMGCRHSLAANAACASVRAAVIGVEIFEVGRTVVLRDVGRFGVAAGQTRAVGSKRIAVTLPSS